MCSHNIIYCTKNTRPIPSFSYSRSVIASIDFLFITGNISLLLLVMVAIGNGSARGRGSCSIVVDELLSVRVHVMGHLHLMELIEEGGILVLPTSKRGGGGRERGEEGMTLWLGIIIMC